MRITSKGQVTIPIAIREKAGLMPNTDVEFEYDGSAVLIRRAASRKGKSRRPTRGEKLVELLRGTGSRRMTTDEIMALTRDYGRDE
jgi:AbrB family looped-hinge helix DNA binding protein